jgi:hypothetical protein
MGSPRKRVARWSWKVARWREVDEWAVQPRGEGAAQRRGEGRRFLELGPEVDWEGEGQ